MISLQNINKKYKQNVIFDNFSYDFDDNQFHIIFGPSGCGKTTLLNIIGLLDNIDSGVIKIDNQIVLKPFSKAAKKYYQNHYSYIFQDYLLVEHKTVLYNLKILGFKEDKIKEVLEVVKLGDKINEKAYNLSGGEKQRVAIARAILKKPKVILADEPTSALDKENVGLVMQILRDLNKEGVTIILITHDTSNIIESDKVLTLG